MGTGYFGNNKTILLLSASILGSALCAGIAFAIGGSAIAFGILGLFPGPAFILGIESFKLSGLKARSGVLEKLLDTIGESVIITDRNATIEDVNRSFLLTTGYSRGEVIGKNPGIMKSGRHGEAFYKEMWASLLNEGSWQGEIWDRKKSGEVYPKLLTIEAVGDRKSPDMKYIGVFSDVSAIKKSEEQIEYLLRHDRLTGLPNRQELMLGLMREFHSAKVRRGAGALLIVNINRFKGVNEAFGFEGGDQALKEAARRLGEMFLKKGMVARTGSDEFSIVLAGTGGPEYAAAEARSIIKAMSEPFIVKSQYVYMGVNIGIAMFPDGADTYEKIPGSAQKALADAKAKGTNHFEFYDRASEGHFLDKLRVETNLRLAVQNMEFVLHYQPLVKLATGEIYGAEALIRRVEPDQLIQPLSFIGVAEETGLIIDICEWTLAESLRQLAKWTKEGIPDVLVSVNATARQFHEQRIVPKTKEILKETGLSPKRLKFEVTERAIMHDAEGIIRQLHELKDMGVKLSIDDFGTGYSSLGYLRRFPVDTIKIDISFVHEIGRSKEGETLVKAIINLSHDLGFKALAEGVETKEQLDFLSAHGCDEIQGFYFSRPLTADRFALLVREKKDFREKL